MKKSRPLFFALLFLTQALVAQVDTVPPVLVCKQVQSIGFFLCNLTLSASDFIDTLYDNSTPATQIEVGIRKICTGAGFPENQNQVNYSTGTNLGYQAVELWARDNAGNQSSCYTAFWLNETGFNCKEGGMTALAYDTQGSLINAVNFKVKGQNCTADSVDFEGYSTDAFGPPFYYYYHLWDTPLRPGFAFDVTPSKNEDPLNGVTELDLKLISRHILGLESFSSPYQFIAADANQDGKVTKLDIILLYQLIHGFIPELPNGKSWRFVPYGYTFPNPQNPFVPPFDEKISVPNTADPIPNSFGFMGVKIGDVDFSASPDE